MTSPARTINTGRNLPLATAVGLGLLGLVIGSLYFERWFFAALAAFLFMKESLPPIGWIGAAAIFSATVIVQLPDKADSRA